MKQKILEYYEGDPDYIANYETRTELSFRDTDAIAFGFFPISLDKDYEFFSGTTIHRTLANQAALKIVGRALSHVSQDYIDDWMTTEAYDKSYGIGRFWKDNNVISFWEAPCDELLIDIVKRLGVYDNKELLIVNDSGEFTLDDYMNNFEDVEDWGEKMTFRIDPKVAETIRSYNQPAETWQSMKEKEGWKTLAQRNATIYQENRQRVDEYFAGDPDTVGEYNDEDKSLIRDWNYRDPNVISFGYFQTSLDGGKEFIYKLDICHYDIAGELATKVIGKAMASEDITNHDVNYVKSAIYHSAAYKGRIFLDPKIVTTWYKVKREKLAELLNMMGGVEKYADFIYVCESIEKNVMEYINEEQVQPHDGMDRLERIKAQMEKDAYSPDEAKMKDNVVKWLDSRVVDIIREYNTPNSTLAAKTSKLGNMTIAQYNSLIHQEEKEPKQTIKENDINMKNNKYQEEFSNYISIMTEALKKGDYKAYDYVKEMLDEAVEDSKHENKLANELNTNNFGILNHIFEERLPELFKNNKKAVRNVIKLIKEDNNLSSQFNYYNAIRNYHGKITEIMKPEDVANRLKEAIVPTINKKTLMESNAKFRKVLKENNIIPTEFINDEMRTLYESGHNILTKSSSVSNLVTLAESTHNICEYMNKHKDDEIKEAIDPNKLVENFENKLKDTLTESEMSFVQQITDFRSPIAEQRKEKLFNKFKNECIDKINTMLKEDADNVELKALSEQISGMQFNKESIVKDIAKLLEIRDILMDD